MFGPVRMLIFDFADVVDAARSASSMILGSIGCWTSLVEALSIASLSKVALVDCSKYRKSSIAYVAAGVPYAERNCRVEEVHPSRMAQRACHCLDLLYRSNYRV
jgi:hypothetical protein